MNDESVVIIGGGIAGLTAGALLAYEGLSVTILESHYQPGGCAGTFRRGKYVFDVGATQVAGMEPGGIHDRLFRHMKLSLPEANVLEPACLVDLADGKEPISLWYDPQRWHIERLSQFPGSELFWSLCSALHRSNWAFAGRDPILPTRNKWDFIQLIKALRLSNLCAGLFTTLSIADLLNICGCGHNHRLRHFLDLQLKLFSQKSSDQTAALYGATVLQIAQAPLGLWHLQGSMQKLSEKLTIGFSKNGGRLLLNHKVIRLNYSDNKNNWLIDVLKKDGQTFHLQAKDVICSLPPQSLLQLMPLGLCLSPSYRRCLEKLPIPSGAIVFYGAIKRKLLPNNIPAHIQLSANNPGSLFISISREGDGRAPLGEATVIASIFTDVNKWSKLNQEEYQSQKQKILTITLQVLEQRFGIVPKDWIHKELATPKSFAYWTGRPDGIVGGLGQNPLSFGLFGLPSRTPMKGLWLCGDSIYPGEGTAGVSQSALMACRQLMASRGKEINIAS